MKSQPKGIGMHQAKDTEAIDDTTTIEITHIDPEAIEDFITQWNKC